jgi:glycosyltransferase involved in cell wall biosynthesis
MKLAVFSGQYFWFDGKNYSTDEAFIKFVTSFYPHFEKIIFCDAVIGERKTQAYILDPKKTDVCPLPYFSVYAFWRNMFVIFPRIYRVIRANAHDWDVIWLHAPHPVSLIFAYVCRRLRKPFFLFIRQNLKVYAGYRNRGAKRVLAILAAIMLEDAFRLISRSALTFTVGKEMFDKYRKRGKRVYQTAVSLISEKDITHDICKQIPRSSNQIKLLSVGRLDPEKGIVYLIEALHALVSNGKTDIILELVGTGKEEELLRLMVNKRGLSQYVHFLGYVSHGPHLFTRYRESDIFVLPSLTEGQPQTLFEAMACGVPVVATRVGGIRYLIEDGENGLLICPASSKAICQALERLMGDSRLRKRLIRNGLSTAKKHSLEAERDSVILCIQEFLGHAQSCP